MLIEGLTHNSVFTQLEGEKCKFQKLQNKDHPTQGRGPMIAHPYSYLI